MKFDIFFKIITKVNNNDLLGNFAHQKMLPKDRIKDLELLKTNIENAKKAAVLILFVPKNDEAHFIIIKRNSYNGVHSAQIAFPGGKPEISDENLEDTAKRETWEEIGFEIQNINIINCLSDVYIQPSDFLVTPFLAYSLENSNYLLDPKEVVQLFEIPVKHLLDDSFETIYNIQTSYSNQKIEVPAFLFENEIVWGATAMMLAEVKAILQEKLK